MILTNKAANPQIPLIKLKYVVIHYTANYNKGSNAIANRNYFNTFREGSNTSAHYVVDDKQIVQCVEDLHVGYHVGAKQYTTLGQSIREGTANSPNKYTIGIEMCVNSDGNFDKMYQNTVDLVIYLLKKYNLTMDNITTHNKITGKLCPAFMLKDEEINIFKEKVNKILNPTTIIEKPIVSKPVLRLGYKGEDVKELQERLKKIGYIIDCDGLFGKQTESIVKSFQKRWGLENDGIVGSKTYNKLDEVEKMKYPLIKLNSKGDYVKILQQNLSDLGYKISIDGIFGNGTLAIVREFQRKYGLIQDGIVGNMTWQKILTAEKPSIEVVEISKDYEAFKRDKYINVFKIRRDKIKKVNLIVANTKNKLQSLDSMYKGLSEKPIAMINGGLYFIDDKTGIASSLNLLFTNDITYSTGVYSKKGFLFYPDGTINFGEFKYTKGLQMIGGSPSIIENGKVILDKGKMENSIITGREPRTALGMNDNYFYCVEIDGRDLSKGWYGMTIKELSNFMLNDLGCKFAINLDGGYSSKMIVNSRQYSGMVTNRGLHNSLAIYNK